VVCVFSCWWSCELEGGGGVRGRGERAETGGLSHGFFNI